MEVFAYKLIDPALLYEKSLLIRRIIFPEADSYFDGNQVRFDVSPYTGFITFFNYKVMWQTKGELGVLNTIEKAEKFATDFLKSVNQRMASEINLQKAKIPPLFPQGCNLNHLETGAVMHPESGEPDHWISRYGISLLASYEFKKNRVAPLLYAAVEVRTTFKGQIIGLNIRWRPFVNTKRIGLLPLIKTEPHHEETETQHSETEHEETDAIESNQDKIVYTLDTTEAPKVYLAPYYFTAGHDVDTGTFATASELSLVVDIFQLNRADGVELFPMVSGGRGNYNCHWGVWQIDEVAEQGIKYLGKLPNIKLNLGVYNVILDVEDAQTLQVKRFEKTIYAKGILETEISNAPLA